MKKILFSITAMIGLIIPSLAQGLEGKVVTELGEPMIGVLISNLSSGTHAHSNEIGEFYIDKTEARDSIEFSYIGYEDLALTVKNKSFLIVEMTSVPLRISEIKIQAETDPLNLTSKINTQLQSIQSSQEILRIVPGLFIGQHAGGGKAEQLFLRGFDIDHGTDLAISVDGMPVNMVSHAHGQGYADLHFVIPELIEVVSFGKGPHEANVGNFATAGHVSISQKDQLENSSLKVEVGSFKTKRYMGALSLLNKAEQNAYLAFEHRTSDGPFESSQHFKRSNAIFKYQMIKPGKSKFGLSLSHFSSGWDASGQIPQRAVDEGTIGRFGAIDDTEGGRTSRSSIQLEHFIQIDKRNFVRSEYYASNYNFNLYSNFTFFLEDSANGDQIQQQESRNLYGGHTTFVNTSKLLGGEWINSLDAGFRQDEAADVKLANTINRSEIQSFIQLGDISELNYFTAYSTTWNKGRWIINPSIRYDAFMFEYRDQLTPTYDVLGTMDVVISPKLSISYDAERTRLYARSSYGFHSNDARLLLDDNRVPMLAKAWGTDVGAVMQLKKGVLIHLALWHLNSEQELVYVGDAGIVENSGASERKGVELSLRWQILEKLVLSSDISYTQARSKEEAELQDRIPLAPVFTHMLNLDVLELNGFNSRISLRTLGDRPANEDNSIIAKGYNVVDALITYDVKDLQLQLSAQNILNVDWNETQFATESRLSNESESVEEIHFTPGTPFYIQLGLKFSF